MMMIPITGFWKTWGVSQKLKRMPQYCMPCATSTHFDMHLFSMQTTVAALGYVFLILHFGKMIVRPNYVGWNKRGMHIRIKSFLGESLRFKDIKSTDLENGILKITKNGGKKIEIDLNGIETQDMDRLNQILIENSSASNGI